MHASESHLLVYTKGSSDIFVETLNEVLQWLCQAIRLTSTGIYVAEMGMPLALIRQNHHLSFISLSPLELSTTESDDSCWRKMFRSAVIIQRNHTSPDVLGEEARDFKGIEMSFDLMVKVSGVETYFWIDGEACEPAGFILLGFFSALIPVRTHLNLMQWHFESSDMEEDDILDPYSIPVMKHRFAHITDMAALRNSRCFIGIWPEANIMLGTRTISYDIQCSCLRRKKTSWHKKSRAASAAVGFTTGPVPISLTGQGTQTYELRGNTQAYDPGASYKAAIRQSRDRVALVFDAHRRIAWLVPKLSLLLHLCHASFEVDNPNTLHPIKYAQPSPDGAKAACDAFFNQGDIEISRSGDSIYDRTLLREELVRINANLYNTQKTHESPETIRSGLLLQKAWKIYASEVNDQLAEAGVGSDLRIIETSNTTSDTVEAWISLVDEVDAVLVCNHLGNAIESSIGVCPSNPAASPCKASCAQVPSDKDYLVAHIWCLGKLIRENRIHWDQNGEPFKPHDRNEMCWNRPDHLLQKLTEVKSNPHPPEAVKTQSNGAVVFGSSGLNKIRKRKAST